MGRPREFDESQALEKAMQVFWSKGYEATSLGDLTEAMGLSKSSLYDTFGCKHELFLSALEHYDETVGGRVAAELARPGSARAAIRAAFESAVDRAVSGVERRGCLIVNCAAEFGASDPAVAARVRAGMARIENAFHDVVTRGQAAGEIPPGKDPRALARYLTSSINGLRITAKAQADPMALQDIVRHVLASLD